MDQFDQQQFTKNSDFWIGEIRGNIARLNDAAAVVETDIVIPTATNDIQTQGAKIEKVRAFQFEFRRLYKNARQVIPVRMKESIEEWFETTSKKNVITDIKILKYGIQLSNELQDRLFEIGVKDIDVAEPDIFPYVYYEELLDANS
ncbi:MAG: hypothetical protein P1P69_04150 [Methanosarcinaceae archaeon]|nr:hypothetical protein [Methanosarcinaceae archaeon]